MPEHDLFRTLLSKSRETKRFSQRESSVWISNGSYERYNNAFSPLLEGQTISETIAGKPTEKILVLDLMGYGEAFTKQSIPLCKSFPFDNALAVALSDPRPWWLKRLSALKNIDLISGDILLKNTWRQISGWLDEKGSPNKFSVIFCRPGAGWAAIPNNFNVYYYLLQNLWERLAVEGLIITELPSYIDVKAVKEWVDQTKANNNIEASHIPDPVYNLGGKLKILKTGSNLVKLPTIQDVPPPTNTSLYDLALFNNK